VAESLQLCHPIGDPISDRPIHRKEINTMLPPEFSSLRPSKKIFWNSWSNDCWLGQLDLTSKQVFTFFRLKTEGGNQFGCVRIFAFRLFPLFLMALSNCVILDLRTKRQCHFAFNPITNRFIFSFIFVNQNIRKSYA